MIQPRIQSRAVDVHPFVVLLSVLFSATLLGVLGALLAIPTRAAEIVAPPAAEPGPAAQPHRRDPLEANQRLPRQAKDGMSRASVLAHR